MVKIQPFKGFTYRPEDYDVLLRFDHESLNHLQETRRAYINKVPIIDQITTGLIERDAEPHYYIYRQIFKGRESIGLMAELDLQVALF